MNYNINLSTEELGELNNRIKSNRYSKIYKRLLCIKLKNLKYKNIEIAKMLSVTGETITNWLRIYLNKGYDGLCKLNYDGRRTSKLEPYKDIIINLAKEGAFRTLMELKQILKKKYGLEVSKSWLSKYLKKKGFHTKN